MSEEQNYIYVSNRKLRCGYTTGSCAAAAAKAAAVLLLTGQEMRHVELETPSGVLLRLEVQHMTRTDAWARCAVRKDSGDDPDVTNGILIYATVRYAQSAGVVIDGGEGVGRVTLPGLSCPVGTAAINPVPRAMIEKAVLESCAECGYDGGMSVEISIPQGVALANKTYNPRLGIVGGISVLGTSGIVKPMSEQALVDSIEVELKMKRAQGARRILLTPGNYGETYAREQLGLSTPAMAQCSNFVGEALDLAARLGFEEVLLVGHLGKLVKLAGGIFQTHSHTADCRMELITAHAALAGAEKSALEQLMHCVTTDEAVGILNEAGLREDVMRRLLAKVEMYLCLRMGDALKYGVVVFSNRWGALGMTGEAETIISHFREEAE